MEPRRESPGPADHGPGRSAAFLLSQLGWCTANRFRETLEPFGIEPRQFAALRAFAGAEGQSQQMVCAAVGIPPSRMVALVDSLEERGLVERRLNASDRRARAIHLTDQGRETMERITARLIGMESWVCEPLSADERQALIGLLGRLAGHLGLSATVHPDMQTAKPLPTWPGEPSEAARG